MHRFAMILFGASALFVSAGAVAQDAKLPEIPTPTAEKESVHRGRLLATDPAHPALKKPSKAHLVDLKKDTTYVIDLDSAFDNYLLLEGPDGKKLAEDDDGAGRNYNARITFSCPADAKYRVIATTFGDGTGVYVLTIAEKKVVEKKKKK